MSDMVRFADVIGNVHYLTWAQIVDVYFIEHNATATIVTTANGTVQTNASGAYEIRVNGKTAQALRDLLDQRAEDAGDVALEAEEARKRVAALRSSSPG